MILSTNLKTHLSKTLCPKCGSSLDTAKLVPITEMPVGILAHAVCIKCKSENMVRITSMGAGVMPLISDLQGREVKKFINTGNVTFEEVIELHKKLSKESICNLLQKKEPSSVKN